MSIKQYLDQNEQKRMKERKKRVKKRICNVLGGLL